MALFALQDWTFFFLRGVHDIPKSRIHRAMAPRLQELHLTNSTDATLCLGDDKFRPAVKEKSGSFQCNHIECLGSSATLLWQSQQCVADIQDTVFVVFLFATYNGFIEFELLFLLKMSTQPAAPLNGIHCLVFTTLAIRESSQCEYAGVECALLSEVQPRNGVPYCVGPIKSLLDRRHTCTLSSRGQSPLSSRFMHLFYLCVACPAQTNYQESFVAGHHTMLIFLSSLPHSSQQWFECQ